MARIINYITRNAYAIFMTLLVLAFASAIITLVEYEKQIENKCIINGMVAVSLNGNIYCADLNALTPVTAE